VHEQRRPPTCACNNLLLNPSFEFDGRNGNDSPYNPIYWSLITTSFGSWDGTFKLPGGGNFVLHLGSNSQAGGRYQDVTTVPGVTYSVSFWGTGFIEGLAIQRGIVQVGSPGANNTSLAQNNVAQYVNAVWEAPMHQSVADWRQFTYTFTASTSVTRVSFQNIYQGPNGPGANAVNIDLIDLHCR
jgi:hypothetical protein